MINTNYASLGNGYSPSTDQQNLYQKLMEMRGTPYNSYRTVFNDISDEWNSCSEEERKFIEQDEGYQRANLEYAQQFNAFLLDQFGLQFVNSKYGNSAEKVLLSLRAAKDHYHTSTIEDMAKIKSENEKLQKQLKELEALFNEK